MTTVDSPAIDLRRPRRIHVVGVGGSGMRAIAEVLVGMGHRVSGSDLQPSPWLDRLAGLGVQVFVGHDAANLGPPDSAIDLLAISTAVPADNPEVVAARDRSIPVVARSTILAAICGERRTLAVSGTHGKTTTSSLLALGLVGAGVRPSFIVGGEIIGLGSGARWDEGDWLVVEADESDGTFLELPCATAIVTSVEPDHLEHYGTFAVLQDAFDRFLAGATDHRLVCADEPSAAALGRRHGAVSYGTSSAADMRMIEVVGGRASVRFGLLDHGRPVGEVEVPLPGLHNARNAAGAISAALLAGAPFAPVAAAVAGSAGIGRRFQVRGEAGGVTYVDDYAHLPGEVAAALAAARDGKWQRIVCIFQPHRYSRTEALWRDFASAFADADLLLVTDVYAAGETSRPGVSGQLIVDAVTERHPDAPVAYIPTRAELVTRLGQILRPGDLCLTLGAGDLTSLADDLLPGPSVTGDIDAAAAVLGERARHDVPLGQFTTYRVGGPAALLLRAEHEDDLELARRAVVASGIDVLVVGRGSNLLVADSGFPGLVLTLGDFLATVELEGTTVRSGGSVSLPVLARRTAAAGLTGLEWAVGVPGSVGGGVRMNAGGHGSEISETLLAARLFDLTGTTAAPSAVVAADLALGYRRSAVGPAQVVVSAEFGLAEGNRAIAEAELAAIVKWRRENQPGGANAGSVFTNPPGDSAGRLIEAAGCKGRRRGSAFVSPKHANFFQVDDKGRAADVLALMEEVRTAVHQAFGVVLETEVRLIGFPQPSISPGGSL